LDLLAGDHRSHLAFAFVPFGSRSPFFVVQERASRSVALTAADMPGIAAILAKYRDPGLQLADASLVHLANREGIETMFTLDRRDFSVLRLANRRKFRLIP
jgi:predicted nucleic acid-binding protein